MAVFMLGWAITLAMPGDTLSISTYRDFNALGLTDTNLAIGYGAIGISRVVLLSTNGRFPRGPEVRFLCSFTGAFTRFLTGALFLLPYLRQHANLPVACAHHFIMCAAEIYTIGVNAVDRQLRR